jgi:DNA-binding MarR family transcriptional regulator
MGQRRHRSKPRKPRGAEAEPEACNCVALRQAARHVTRLYDEALAPTGLGANQYSILATLERVGPSTVQELAACLVMDRSTLGHLLRPLETRRLVTLDVSEDDGRRRVIAPTAAGKAAVAKGGRLWAQAQRRFERAVGAGAAEELRTFLKRVATADFG